MTTFKNQVQVNATGDVEKKTTAWSRAMERFAAKGQRSLTALSKTMPHLSAGLDKLSNRYTALLSGGAAYAAVKNAAAMETRLARLGIAADKSKDDMRALHNEIYAVAQDKSINVSADEIISGIEQIVAKTGDLDVARANLENLGMIISATGSRGEEAGAMIADMVEKFDIKTPDDLLKTMDLLAKQGKEGSFELADLATQGNRVTSAYAGIGRGGIRAAAELGALTQTIRSNVGSAEQTATVLEAYMRALNDNQTRKRIRQKGVKLFEDDDPKKMRSAVEIMKDIIKVTKGDVSKIGQIFTSSEASKAFYGAARDFQNAGNFDFLDKLVNLKADGQTLSGDSKRVAATLESSLVSLKSAVEMFSNNHLAEPIQNLANALNRVDPEKLQKTLKVGAIGIGAIGTMVLAKKGFDFAKGAYGIYSDIFGKGGGAGALASAVGVQKVFVVNMPGGFGGFGGNGGKGGFFGGFGKGAKNAGKLAKAGKTAKNLSKFGKMKNVLGKGGAVLNKAAVPLMIAGTALEFATADTNADRAGAVGSLAGGLAGAKAGALLGAFAGPVGAAIGGVLGGVAGSIGGDKLLRSFFDDKKDVPAVSAPVSVKNNAIHLIFDNAPKGLRVSNPLDFIKIEVNTGTTEGGDV